MTSYPKHTPHSLSWRIVAVIDGEMQRLAVLYLDCPPGPAREGIARRADRCYRLRQAAIRGTLR